MVSSKDRGSPVSLLIYDKPPRFFTTCFLAPHSMGSAALLRFILALEKERNTDVLETHFVKSAESPKMSSLLSFTGGRTEVSRHKEAGNHRALACTDSLQSKLWMNEWKLMNNSLCQRGRLFCILSWVKTEVFCNILKTVEIYWFCYFYSFKSSKNLQEHIFSSGGPSDGFEMLPIFEVSVSWSSHLSLIVCVVSGFHSWLCHVVCRWVTLILPLGYSDPAAELPWSCH